MCTSAPDQYLPLQFAALKLSGYLMSLKGACDYFHKDIWAKHKDAVYKYIMEMIIAAGGMYFRKLLLIVGIHDENQPQELCNSLLRRLSHDIPASVITDAAASEVS